MRVALVHNASAGDKSHRAKDLERLFSDAGHEVTVFGKEDRDVSSAIRTVPDVVAAAGGDGTVARVATTIHTMGAKLPMLLLPLGTSNNIARSLGVSASVEELVQALSNLRAVRLDIGVVTAPWGGEPFVEAAGFGFIGVMLERDTSLRERLARARRRLVQFVRPDSQPDEKINRGVARLVREQPAEHRYVRADGEDLSGEYIAVEVMNTREIGPHVSLAPSAETGDALLDLLLVRPADRAALAEHVEAGGNGGAAPPPGITRRVREVQLAWPDRGGHVDDEPWPRAKHTGNGGSAVSVGVGGAVEVLVPA